jgi:large subunit ribosomal protein L4
VVENWNFEQPKTKEARDALEAIGANGKVLLVVDAANVNARKSFKNLANAHVISPMQLNVFDVLVSDVVVFTKENLLSSSTSDKTNENSLTSSNEEETEES